MELDSLTSDIKSLILKVSNISHIKPEEIDNEMPLYGEGLGLDSIDLLELVVHLEKEYALTIKNDDRGRKVLRNVNSIAAAVKELQRV